MRRRSSLIMGTVLLSLGSLVGGIGLGLIVAASSAGPQNLPQKSPPPALPTPSTEEAPPLPTDLPDPVLDQSVLVLPPCVMEDDQNCYWDASVRGNGVGTSFINLNGTYYYEEEK